MRYLSGFESTFMPQAEVDVLALTRHLHLWRDDLQLAKDSGLDCLRYPVPWHRIEVQPGVYEWGWMDEVMGYLQESRIDPIVDLVHHTSFPLWMENGFAHPDFCRLEETFAQAFAERYPWVRQYTIFNEPFVTTLLCGHEGVWYPYCKGPWNLFPMMARVGQAICNISRMLDRIVPGARFIHVETCEHHQPLDPESEGWVEHMNDRRFLMHDLVLGRIDENHPLFGYLGKYGFPLDLLTWFRENPTRIDVLGLDYYAHSEHQYHKSGGIVPSTTPRGFAAVARDYIERYQVPVMLSETNIRGFVSDRLSWL
ncbi:MAG: family 1 glycosylhydrolase [Armatimonadetes bacterium]|nr:family 1 glycosylhydrolase [Armatimonadota bacterium]